MIAGFGGCALDRISYISRWPDQEQTSYIESSRTAPGGMTLNALLASSRLGVPSSYRGALGSDDEGDFLINSLKRAGVDTDLALRIADGETPASQVMITPGGKRTIFHKRGIRMQDYLPGLPLSLEGISLLLLDGSWMKNTLEWAEKAATMGIPVVLDLSPNNTHPLRDKLLALADYKAISCELAGKITGIDDPREQVSRLSGTFGGVCLVTKGPGGLWVNIDNNIRHLPSYKVETVDSTGAGDTFHGALAAALDLAFPAEEAIRLAMAAAALKCTGKGHDKLPDMKRVKQFMKDAPE